MSFEKCDNFINNGVNSALDSKMRDYIEISDKLSALQKYLDTLLSKTENKSKQMNLLKFTKLIMKYH